VCSVAEAMTAQRLQRVTGRWLTRKLANGFLASPPESFCQHLHHCFLPYTAVCGVWLQGYRPSQVPQELIEQIAAVVEAKAFLHVVGDEHNLLWRQQSCSCSMILLRVQHMRPGHATMPSGLLGVAPQH